MIRVIAIGAARRQSGDFAQVPTWKEYGVEGTFPNWRCVIGPRGFSTGDNVSAGDGARTNEIANCLFELGHRDAHSACQFRGSRCPVRTKQEPHHTTVIGVEVEHLGYMDEVMDSRRKNERNERLFCKQLADDPDDIYSLYKFGDFLRRGLPRAESAAGQVEAE